MGKWHLRRTLLGLADPRPEQGRDWLVIYAYAIWIYRFFLYLGIAAAVYFLFFKALGIALFVVEIVYFLGAPVYRELRQWSRRYSAFRTRPAFLRSLAVVAGLAALLAVPWSGSVQAPAYIGAEYRTVYAPEAARLVSLDVHEGSVVRSGQLLARFHAPDLEHELTQAVRHRDELLWEREAMGIDSLRRERALVIRAELASQNRLIGALQQRLARLDVVAEMGGRVVDLPEQLGRGDWVPAGAALFAIRGGPEGTRIVAFLDEAEVGRVRGGAKARFVPEPGVWPEFDAAVAEISPGGLERVDKQLVTSTEGGGVDVRVVREGEAVPLRATYEVILTPETSGPDLPPRELRGRVSIEAEPQSLLKGFWVRLLALLRREAGA